MASEPQEEPGNQADWPAPTGESITLAVTIALRERLERQKPNPKEGLADWLDELTKRTAPLLKDLPPSDKIGNLLFDKETGLPL